MKTLNRNYIAPRVQVMDMRGTHTTKPLSKRELTKVLSALRNTGIDNIFSRMMDDMARHTIDNILKTI